jgi:transcriptional regulator with XRE-family HTH domain
MPSLPKSSYTRIGQRIRELRIRNSLSRSELAGKARLKAGYISRLEDGYEIPDCGTLRVLAGALSVPLYYLFCAGEEPLPTPRLTPRPTLDELVVDGCVRSKANSIFGAICTTVLSQIELCLYKVLPSSVGQRSANSRDEGRMSDG